MTGGIVFDIQRFCTHDGPGIRTTVFLKGCPLQCAWCHNPESQQAGPELLFTAGLCIDCGACEAACPRGEGRRLLAARAGGRGDCLACFKCTEACPAGAIEVAGREMAVEAVMAEVVKDRVFFEESGGGMTLSGGEPLARFEFARDLLRSAKGSGLHTAIETSGCATWPRIEAVLPHADLFLWDIKDTDPGRHRQATGAPLEPILDNLRRLDAAEGRTRLRCLLIDGVNLDARHLERLAELFHSLGHCQGVELLPYHPMGRSKLERLGRPLPATCHAEPSREVLEAARTSLKEQTVTVIES